MMLMDMILSVDYNVITKKLPKESLEKKKKRSVRWEPSLGINALRHPIPTLECLG